MRSKFGELRSGNKADLLKSLTAILDSTDVEDGFLEDGFLEDGSQVLDNIFDDVTVDNFNQADLEDLDLHDLFPDKHLEEVD